MTKTTKKHRADTVARLLAKSYFESYKPKTAARKLSEIVLAIDLALMHHFAAMDHGDSLFSRDKCEYLAELSECLDWHVDKRSLNI